ncbi:MAG: hypothetical protein ABWX90_03825 [Candidatus Saccharimonadales bacterium]
MKRIGVISSVVVAVLMATLVPAIKAAAANSQLTQTINAGVLSTSVLNAGGAVVASPSFAMTAGVVSTSSQQTVTGTFGSDSQRITVDNPGASATGFTLTLAATAGPTATWTDGAKTYPFNAASAALGQLTVNATPGILTPVTGTATGIAKGNTATFAGGLNTPVNLLNAGSTSDDVWNGYLTGVSLSQTIPAGTPAGSYSISLTQTVTAQ